MDSDIWRWDINMKILFSPSSSSFYPFALRDSYKSAGTWPNDAIEATGEEWQTYGQGTPPTGMQRGADANGRPAWVEIPPEPADLRRERQLNRIDTTAGQARLRYVSAGQLIEEEYRQAKFAVQAWRAAGNPADAVPPEIISGAEYSNITHEQAAVEIEQTAEKWEGVLSAIRDLRLGGKAAVKAASDGEIESVAAGYIEQLEAMAPVDS